MVIRIDISKRALVALLAVPGLLMAATVTADVPNIFQAETVVSAEAMNQNFSALDERLTSLEANKTELQTYTLGVPIVLEKHEIGEEQATGKTWIDGQPIYRRIVTVNELPKHDGGIGFTDLACSSGTCSGKIEFVTETYATGVPKDGQIVWTQILATRKVAGGTDEVHIVPASPPVRPEEWTRAYFEQVGSDTWRLVLSTYADKDGVWMDAQSATLTVIVEYTKP